MVGGVKFPDSKPLSCNKYPPQSLVGGLTETLRRFLYVPGSLKLETISCRGWRPSLVGWRPSLIGWRPSAFFQRGILSTSSIVARPSGIVMTKNGWWFCALNWGRCENGVQLGLHSLESLWLHMVAWMAWERMTMIF